MYIALRNNNIRIENSLDSEIAINSVSVIAIHSKTIQSPTITATTTTNTIATNITTDTIYFYSSSSMSVLG